MNDEISRDYENYEIGPIKRRGRRRRKSASHQFSRDFLNDEISDNVKYEISLPEFSAPVRRMLEAGRAQDVWTEMLRELTDLYAEVDRNQPGGFRKPGKVAEMMYRCLS